MEYDVLNADRIQSDLVIRGFFSADSLIHECKISLKSQNSYSKCVFLSENSVFMVQNSGTYLPQITKLTCAQKNEWNFEKVLENFK